MGATEGRIKLGAVTSDRTSIECIHFLLDKKPLKNNLTIMLLSKGADDYEQ